jgi:hypothetical protein
MSVLIRNKYYYLVKLRFIFFNYKFLGFSNDLKFNNIKYKVDFISIKSSLIKSIFLGNCKLVGFLKNNVILMYSNDFNDFININSFDCFYALVVSGHLINNSYLLNINNYYLYYNSNYIIIINLIKLFVLKYISILFYFMFLIVSTLNIFLCQIRNEIKKLNQIISS